MTLRCTSRHADDTPCQEQDPRHTVHHAHDRTGSNCRRWVDAGDSTTRIPAACDWPTLDKPDRHAEGGLMSHEPEFFIAGRTYRHHREDGTPSEEGLFHVAFVGRAPEPFEHHSETLGVAFGWRQGPDVDGTWEALGAYVTPDFAGWVEVQHVDSAAAMLAADAVARFEAATANLES